MAGEDNNIGRESSRGVLWEGRGVRGATTRNALWWVDIVTLSTERERLRERRETKGERGNE